MKGLAVFLVIAVAAVSGANVAVPVNKNIIDDALAMIQCVKDAAVAIQSNVGNVVGAVNGVTVVIGDTVNKLEACSNLGDPISIAGCIMNVANSAQAEITQAVIAVEDSVAELLVSVAAISKCTQVSTPANKGIIEDALAMIKCLRESVAAIEASIGNVVGAVNGVSGAINGILNNLEACSNLGDPLSAAACIMNVASTAQAEITNAISAVESSVQQLLASVAAVGKCTSGSTLVKKNIIDDALALIQCIIKAAEAIEASVGNVVASVNGVSSTVQGIVNDLAACSALENPINAASCIINVASSAQAQIVNAISAVEASVSELLAAVSSISKCF